MLDTKGKDTIAPLRVRTRMLLVLGLVAALSVVAGTNARPASAYAGLAVLPASVAGTVTAVPGALVAGAALGGFAAGYYGAEAVYEFIFNDRDYAAACTTSPCTWTSLPSPGYETVPRNLVTGTGGYWYIDILGSAKPSSAYAQVLYEQESDCTYAGQDTNWTSSDPPLISSGRWRAQYYFPNNSYPGCLTLKSLKIIAALFGDESVILDWTYSYQAVQKTTCRATNGAVTTIDSDVLTWGAGQAPPALDNPTDVCTDALGTGAHVTGVKVVGGRPGETRTLIDNPTVKPEVEAGTQYADCWANDGPVCTVQLYKGTGVDAQPCESSSVYCDGWHENLSDYSCRWVKPNGAGYYSLPLSDCDYLATAYDGPAEVEPTPPNTDPVDPVPGTIGAGTTVTNPDGSTTTTQTQTLPDGTTRTVTTTTHPDGSKTITTQPLNPDGTPNGSPAIVNIPAPGTGSEPGTEGETAGCMGSWTWNPVAWVYRPIKCALQWAFVPRTSVMTAATDGVADAWSGTAPAVVMEAVGDLSAPATSLEDNPELDCLGPGFTFHIWDDPWTMHPFSACGAFAAWVSSVTLPIETFLVWFAALFVGARLVLRTVGMDTPDSGAA